MAALAIALVLTMPGLSRAQQAGNGPPAPQVQPAPQSAPLPPCTFAGGAWTCNAGFTGPVTNNTVLPAGGSVASTLGSLTGRVLSIMDFGAKCNGTANDSAALQAALDANPGGIILVPPARCAIAGNVTIPANTQIICQTAPPGAPESTALNTEPAIVLTPGDTISAAGDAAGVKNCLIVAAGITYPVSTEPTWTGTALADAGQSDFSVINSTIVGFNSAIKITGARPYLQRDYLDGTGNGTNQAVLELDVGNTDSGYVSNIKIQPIGTVNSCTAGPRPGTGLRVGGTPIGAAGIWLDKIVAQNFVTADYDFENSAIVGNLWADDQNINCSETLENNGVIVASGVTVYGGSMTIGQSTSTLINSGSLNLNYLYTEFAGGNCITQSGVLIVHDAWTVACTGYSVAIENANAETVFGSITPQQVHGSVAPYFASGVGTVAFGSQGAPSGSMTWTRLNSDISGYLFDSNFTATAGGATMLAQMHAPVTLSSCTGLGTGGTCTIASQDGNAAVVTLTAGTSASPNGTFQLNPAAPASGTLFCSPVFVTANWTINPTATCGTTPSYAVVKWDNGGTALSNGTSYSIQVTLDPR